MSSDAYPRAQALAVATLRFVEALKSGFPVEGRPWLSPGEPQKVSQGRLMECLPMLAQCWWAPLPNGGGFRQMERSDDLPADVRMLVDHLWKVFDHYGWRLCLTGMLIPGYGAGRHNKTPWMWPGVPSLPQELLSSLERVAKGLSPSNNGLAEEAMPTAPSEEKPMDEMPAPETKQGATVEATSPRPKRSTHKGEAEGKLIAALTKHHQYDNGSRLNLDPIGNNVLARQADVSISTASGFFAAEFGEYANYRAACKDATKLSYSLKLLRGEVAPTMLFSRTPPGEGRDDMDE